MFKYALKSIFVAAAVWNTNRRYVNKPSLIPDTEQQRLIILTVQDSYSELDNSEVDNAIQCWTTHSIFTDVFIAQITSLWSFNTTTTDSHMWFPTDNINLRQVTAPAASVTKYWPHETSRILVPLPYTYCRTWWSRILHKINAASIPPTCGYCGLFSVQITSYLHLQHSAHA